MPNEEPLYKSPSSFPKLSKVWRTHNYHIGYICPTCGDVANCQNYVVLTCPASDHFVKNNEWHHHCTQKKFVVVKCLQGHLSRQLVRTGCECGWANSEDLFE